MSGVFNSCEASATNCFCDSQASLTGRNAQFDKKNEMTKKTARIAIAAIRSDTARDSQELVDDVSANATYVALTVVRFS